MTPASAKKAAEAAKCILWYDRSYRVWSLHHADADEIEASGGCFMSPGELKALSAAKFAEYIERAQEGQSSD